MQTSNPGKHTIGTIHVDPHPEQRITSVWSTFPTVLHGFKTRKWTEKNQVTQNLLEEMW